MTSCVSEKGRIQLPDELKGWKKQGEVREYSPATIFDYMNGAGEIYRAYDLVKLVVQEYSKPNAPSAVVEIYEMPSSQDAYGIYTFDTDGQKIQIGKTEAIYGAGLLRFWKGIFFMRLMAQKETSEAHAFLESMARHIAKSIKAKGSRPDMLEWLPKTGLEESTIRYFHSSVILNVHYYIAEANLLNMSNQTEAVLARYKLNQEKVRVLVIKYPSAREAKSAAEQFEHQYKGVQCIGNVLILIFEATNPSSAKKIISDITQKIKGR
jgi:hypothetical protein